VERTDDANESLFVSTTTGSCSSALLVDLLITTENGASRAENESLNKVVNCYQRIKRMTEKVFGNNIRLISLP
jgi:hypothetical protein